MIKPDLIDKIFGGRGIFKITDSTSADLFMVYLTGYYRKMFESELHTLKKSSTLSLKKSQNFEDSKATETSDKPQELNVLEYKLGVYSIINYSEIISSLEECTHMLKSHSIPSIIHLFNSKYHSNTATLKFYDYFFRINNDD